MKKVIFLMLSFALVTTTKADDYIILQMNTPTIKIGNKVCKEGSVFSDKSKIFWTKKEQAIKAKNLRTKEIKLFVEQDLRKHKSKSVFEYFIRTNHLSTRESAPTMDELTEQLSKTFYMLDEICVKCHVPTDSSRYYFVRYQKNSKMVESPLSTKDDYFVIPRSLFDTGDVSVDEDVKVSVYFRDGIAGEDFLLTDSMIIQILPLRMEE